MQKIKKILKWLGIGTSLVHIALAPMKAKADTWQNLTATYNLNSGENVLKFQRGTDNTYGLLNLYGDKVNFGTMYGKFNVRKNIGKGFKIGAEANFGTGMIDLVKPQLAYSRNIDPIFVDVKYSPIESTGKTKQELGIFATTNIKGIEIGGWSDISYDPKTGKITNKGEIEVSKKLGKTSLVARIESYPWKDSGSPKFSVGIKKDL